jgi:hypothetical protein
MNKPKISWYAKRLSDEKYSVESRFYAGKYTDNDQIIVDIQLWNNRWGAETVEDLKNYDICLFFDRVEDSALLDMCTIIYNNSYSVPYNISGRKAILEMETKPVIKGTKNNGSSADNPNNFLQFRFIFNGGGLRLKDNDLKSLYFEVIER